MPIYLNLKHYARQATNGLGYNVKEPNAEFTAELPRFVLKQTVNQAVEVHHSCAGFIEARYICGH